MPDLTICQAAPNRPAQERPVMERDMSIEQQTGGELPRQTEAATPARREALTREDISDYCRWGDDGGANLD
jgi:hypothetical protein